MKLSPELHPALDKRSVALLAQYNVRSLAQLLATRPEKLASMLAISYTAAAELRRQLFQQFSSFPSLGLEDYQARLEREVTVSTGSTQLDTLLGGGLLGGRVTEVYGYPGTGKTQLCLTAAVTSLLRTGGSVAYIDTKGDFCPQRLLQILEARSPAAARDQVCDRLRLCSATSAAALLEAVTRVETMEEVSLVVVLCTVLYCVCTVLYCTELFCAVLQVRLVVVDNISRPLMRLVINSELQRALSLAARVTQLLHKV